MILLAVQPVDPEIVARVVPRHSSVTKQEGPLGNFVQPLVPSRDFGSPP